MSKSFFFCLATCLFFLFPLTISAKSQPGIEFKENKGQWDSRILYRAELNNGYMFITRKGISYIFFNHRSFKNFPSNSDTSSLSNARDQPVSTTADNQIKVHAFSLDFTGMNESAEIHASSKHAARYNYFTGNDPSKWASNVPSFGMITYKDLYPGIDFRISS